MMFTFEYKNTEDRNDILKRNADKFLIEEKNLLSGNFLVFSNTKPLVTEILDLKLENKVLLTALAESIEKQESDKTANQLVLAELMETLTIKGVL